jgi:hypothetical protein
LIIKRCSNSPTTAAAFHLQSQEAERNRPAHTPDDPDDDDEWGQDGPPVDYLADVTRLRQEEKDRRDFARAIQARVDDDVDPPRPTVIVDL